MHSGFLLINKPSGITSHDVVDYLRKISGVKKIGHAGTLDPFAEGLLIVGVGRPATKRLSFFLKKNKEYCAVLLLGVFSDTYDIEGEIVKQNIKRLPSLREIHSVINSFLGEQYQLPPMFSAKKVKGKKLYELARKGIEVKRKPHKIYIYELIVEEYNWPCLKIKIVCSSGTYIRTLAKDIGNKLGCKALLKELKRTKINGFDIKNAVHLDHLNQNNWHTFLFDIKEG